MEVVTGDPSLNPVSHEFEIKNDLAVLRVLEELRRGAPRARTRRCTIHGLVRGDKSVRLSPRSRRALKVRMRFHVDPLPLIIPIGCSIDYSEFRVGKGVALETVRVFPP